MPSETKLHELSFTSFKQCDEKAQLNAKAKRDARGLNAERLNNSLKRMVDEARLYDKSGDEERAYIIYYRCTELADLVTKARDFRSNTKINKRTVYDTFKQVLERTEKLQTSLMRRYEIKAEADGLSRLEEAQSNAPKSNEQDNFEKPKTEDQFAGQSVIKCIDLYQLVNDKTKQSSVLILDFRPENQRAELFSMESKTGSSLHLIYIPEEFLTPGCISSTLSKRLPVSDRALFNRRNEVDFVIVLDDASGQSTLANAKKNKPLSILIDALTTYNGTISLKRPPLLLEGGFINWKLHYPMHCIKAPDFEPSNTIQGSHAAELADVFEVNVAYPELDKLLDMNRRAIPQVEPEIIEEIAPQPTVTQELPKPTVTQQPGATVPQPSATVPQQPAHPSRPIIPDRSLKPTVHPERKEVDDAPVVEPATVPVEEPKPAESLENRDDATSKNTETVIPTDPPAEATVPTSTETVNVEPAPDPKIEKVTPAPVEPEKEQKPTQMPAVDRTVKPAANPQNDTPQERFDQTVLQHLGLKTEAHNFEEKLRNVQNDLNAFDAGRETPLNNTIPTVNSNSSANIRTIHNPVNVGPPRPSIDRSNKPKEPTDLNLVAFARGEQQHAAKMLQRDAISAQRIMLPGLSGLRNNGNTCYANACLQCVSNVAPLREFFRNKFVADINRRNKMGTGGILACNYGALQLMIWSGGYRVVNPLPVLQILARQARMFGDGRQHDAQEFLVTLLDALHEDVNRIKQPQVVSQNNDNKALTIAAKEAWDNSKKFSSSYIYDLFQGQLVSVVECSFCGTRSTTFDTFTQVTLELPYARNCYLDDCLHQHLRSETMRGDARWKCPKCAQLRDATKTMRFWRLPPVLIIHLKRFEQRGLSYAKKEISVDFPIHALEMDDLVHSQVQNQNLPNSYQLFAVTNHRGTLEHGHYTAMCRNSESGTWFGYDDDEVASIGEERVRSSSAYILYYTNIDWFRSR